MFNQVELDVSCFLASRQYEAPNSHRTRSATGQPNDAPPPALRAIYPAQDLCEGDARMTDLTPYR